MSAIDEQKYRRQIALPEVGRAGQQKLRSAKVLIIGVGGLGCPAAQYLAAAGVGTLGLLDDDTVDRTNLHRQILFGEPDVGKAKVAAARNHLTTTHSDLAVKSYHTRFTPDNALTLLADYDCIIDGTDNFQTKYLINDACLKAQKSWVYASMYKFQGQLSIFNHHNGPTYRCAFPTGSRQNVSCKATGVLGALAGTLGVMQAAEALKLILEIGTPLSGSLALIDLLHNRRQHISITKNEAAVQQRRNSPLQLETIYCSVNNNGVMYLDVREPHEQPRITEGAYVVEIPLGQLHDRHKEIPRNSRVQVVCQSGKRSARAVELLKENYGFDNIENVPKGIESIITPPTVTA